MSITLPQLQNQLQKGQERSNDIVPFMDTIAASLGYTYDPILEFLYNQVKYPDIDLNYSPKDNLEGYEEYQDHLLYARNSGHMESMKRGIKENEARREVLSNSSFWSQIGAGIFDPVNIIALPLGGPALTVGKTFARGAIGIGGLQTGLEAIRYPVDPLGSVTESALNVGFAAVTGGLITSALSVPAIRRSKAIEKTVKQHEENYNVGYEFTTLGQMTNEDIKISQKPSSRKQYKNKTSVDLRNEANLNFKTISGYNKILKDRVFSDGKPATTKDLQTIQNKRKKLEEDTLRIDKELAIRRLEAEDIKIKDPYNLAAGAWVANLISTPAKRILKASIPDSVKRTSVELFADGGMLMNLHKLGFSHGPSIHQLAKIMDGEWVGAHSDLMKIYGDSIKMRIKSVGGVQIKDAATRIGNKFSKQKVQTSDEWFREVNRKRTFGEKVDSTEAEAVEIINKFFKKWEERLEEVGLIGSKKRIESLVAEGRIKRERIVNQFNTYKNPRARWVEDFNVRLDRLDAQLEEWEFSLATMADESFVPIKGEEFLPRYWDKNYIIANRESFAKILHDWYSKNPYTYEIDGNLKWKRIDLKTTDKDIAERVEKTIDNILGLSDAEDIPNVGAGKSKHLKHRTLDIPNSLVWDYMQQDPLAIMKGYTHKTAGKYQFAKKNNGKNLLEVLDEKIDEMHVAGTPIEKIDEWRMNYKHMYDRIVSSPMKTSPDRWDNKTAYWLKEAAQLNYLGSAGISAIPDFAKIIMEHELGDVIKGLQALLTDTRVTLKGDEAKLVGEAIELIQGNSQFRLMENITNDVTATNTYDRVKNTFYLANGLAPITQLAKTLDSIIRGHSLIDMSIKLTNGKASKLQISYLAKYNIDKNIAAEIAAAPWEKTGNGLYLPNTKAWENNYQFPKHDAIVQYGNTQSYDKDGNYKGAFYRRSNNTIYFDREYIESTFISKPWTKPKMKGVNPLPNDAFESPQSWANFVFMHEIMHNKLAPDAKIKPPKIYTKDDIKKYLNETIFSDEKPNMDLAFHATNDPDIILKEGFSEGGMVIGSVHSDKGYGKYITVFDISEIKKQNKISPNEDISVTYGRGMIPRFKSKFAETMYGGAEPFMKGQKPIAIIHETEVPRMMLKREDGMRSEESGIVEGDWESTEIQFYNILETYALEKEAGTNKSFKQWVISKTDEIESFSDYIGMEWRDIEFLADTMLGGSENLDNAIQEALLRLKKDVKIYNIDPPVTKIPKQQSKAEYENVINELALEQHNAQPRMTEETLTTFRTALQSGILNTVIMGTPADKPIIVDGVAYVPMRVAKAFNMPEDKIVKGYARIESGLLGLPFQFYSYSLGALNKITMSAAQGQMKNRALGLSLSLGLGMLAVQIKTPDFAFENMDWDDWFARGFDQSGIAAMYSDIFYTSMQTALSMGGPNITGGVIKPKFPSEDPYGAAIGIGGAGPSIGYDYASAMKEFFIDGDFSEGAKNFTRSLPFARMWFWKDEMNALTSSFKNW